jgi:hypothetical protein
LVLYTTAGAKCEVPVAPKVLAEAAEAAMHSGDNEWARREAVADLLSADIVYNTMDGKRSGAVQFECSLPIA